MQDLKQEFADVQAAIEKVEAQVQTAARPLLPRPVKCSFVTRTRATFRKWMPSPAAMIPLMGRGYQQYKGD